MIGEYGLPPEVLASPDWTALLERFPEEAGDAGQVLRFLAVAHPEIRADRETAERNNAVYAAICGEDPPASPALSYLPAPPIGVAGVPPEKGATTP